MSHEQLQNLTRLPIQKEIIMQTLEKCINFIDYANMNCGFEQVGVTPDFSDLIDYLTVGRFHVETHVFVPIDPRVPYGRDKDIDKLWASGCLVHSKMGVIHGDTYRCDFDIEMTLEIMRTAELVRPDIIVLATGDKNFIPVILELRRRGIRVETAAFEGFNAAREIIQKSSGFIDLREYIQEFLSTQTENQVDNIQTSELFNEHDAVEDDDEDDDDQISPKMANMKSYEYPH